jgi:hypothetical protein
MKKILFILAGMFLISLVSAAHPLPSDLTNDTTGLIEGIGIWSNEVTQGAFWTFLLLGFCFALGMAGSRYTTDRAFGYAGTTGIFGSLFLATAGLMSWWIATLFIIIGAVSIAVMIISKSR